MRVGLNLDSDYRKMNATRLTKMLQATTTQKQGQGLLITPCRRATATKLRTLSLKTWRQRAQATCRVSHQNGHQSSIINHQRTGSNFEQSSILWTFV